MIVPDLRPDHTEITLEHCWVLINKLGEAFDLLEGTRGVFTEIEREINPELLKNHFEELFEPQAFSRLFSTELGKGVLVGTFAQVLLEKVRAEDEQG